MRIRYGQFKQMISEVLQEAGEVAPGCRVTFTVGETIPLYRDVRVIPIPDDPEGRYFAGEMTGMRAKGSSVPGGLPAGTVVKVVEKKGSSEAWVQCDELDALMRVNINKFCPTKAEQYASSHAGAAPTAKAAPKTPAEKLTAAAQAYKAAKAELGRLEAEFKAAREEYEASLELD